MQRWISNSMFKFVIIIKKKIQDAYCETARLTCRLKYQIYKKLSTMTPDNDTDKILRKEINRIW